MYTLTYAWNNFIPVLCSVNTPALHKSRKIGACFLDFPPTVLLEKCLTDLNPIIFLQVSAPLLVAALVLFSGC